MIGPGWGALTMNSEKARDFFSPYLEGTLESGLRQSFERKLKSDPALNEEYRLFERTVAELNELKLERIEVPNDLHEMISARLDRHLYEQKRSAPSGFAGLWRNLAIGGVAVAALVGAIYTIPRFNGHRAAATASLMPVGASKPSVPSRIEFKAQPNSVIVDFSPSSDRLLTIESGGVVLKRVFARGGDQTATPLMNQQRETSLMTITVQGEPAKHVIALPGTVRPTATSGEGDLTAFAQALSGYYREPVLLEVSDTKTAVKWTFTAADPVKAAMDALVDSHLGVEQRDTRLVTISDR